MPSLRVDQDSYCFTEGKANAPRNRFSSSVDHGFFSLPPSLSRLAAGNSSWHVRLPADSDSYRIIHHRNPLLQPGVYPWRPCAAAGAPCVHVRSYCKMSTSPACSITTITTVPAPRCPIVCTRCSSGCTATRCRMCAACRWTLWRLPGGRSTQLAGLRFAWGPLQRPPLLQACAAGVASGNDKAPDPTSSHHHSTATTAATSQKQKTFCTDI